MNSQKVLELAQKVWSAAGGAVYIGPSIGLLAEFAALVERELRGCAEPVAFEFQHEDTGLFDFVDPQQVEWGFQKNNPRWQLIGPVFRHPAPAVVRQPLTDEQIDALILPESGTGTIRDLVRIIEAAHGIGGNDD